VKRPPRIPTWLIVLATIVFLTGSIALFVVGGDDAAQPKRAVSIDTSDDGSELVLPKGDAANVDDRRRGKAGRTRIDAADGRDIQLENPDDTKPDDGTRLAALRGVKIALVPADSLAPAVRDPAASTKFGTVAVPCSVASTSAVARTLERSVLDELAVTLQSAGAIVTRIDDATGVAPCAPQRSALAERADLTLVVATTDTPGATQGIAGARAIGALSAADTSARSQLTRALVATTGISMLPNSDVTLLRLLARFGVIERAGGGSAAWIVLPAAVAADDAARRLALGLAVARAPQQAPPSAATSPKSSTPPPSTDSSTPTPAPSATTVPPGEVSKGTTAGSDD